MRQKPGTARPFGAAALIIAASLASPASAQSAPPAGLTAPPTREEIERPVAPPPARAPKLDVEGDIERAPCPLDSPAYAEIRVKIEDAIFNNLKGATPEELRGTYSAYLGKDQPIRVICEIRDAAATLLRRKGYLAAVEVPTQRIENGVVRFEVLYARITAIRVRGDAGRTEELIAGYLGRLTKDEIFNRYDAERYLLLARDLPGYDVRLSLRPAGTAPGDLIGEVIVLATPIEADFNLQNLAAKDTGRFSGQMRVQFNGLTGMGDRTSIALYSTADFEEQQILQLAHEFKLGAEGLTLGGRFTYAWTKPDIDAAAGAPEITARTLFASFEASYPFVRTQAADIRGSAGLDFVNQRVRFLGPLSNDRVRVAYLRLDANAIDTRAVRMPKWRVAGTLELRKGLDIFGASERCGAACPMGTVTASRLDGDASATVIRFAGLAEYAVSPMLSVAILPRLQYAFDPLLSFEEYSAGAYTIGRGYDPGTIIGDDGAGFQFELRAGRLQPFASTSLVMQPFVFVDQAWVWNKDRGAAIDPERLTSVGGGVRATWDDRVRLDMILAVPTRRAGLQTEKGDPRLLITLATRLMPWGGR